MLTQPSLFDLRHIHVVKTKIVRAVYVADSLAQATAIIHKVASEKDVEAVLDASIRIDMDDRGEFYMVTVHYTEKPK